MYVSDDLATEAAVSLLREHGPMDLDQWVELIGAHGIADGQQAVELARYCDHHLVGSLGDGRMVTLDTLLEGRIVTHRLTAAEIAADVLDASPDLESVIDLFADSTDIEVVFAGLRGQVLAERGVTDPHWPPNVGLCLERGTLADLRPGDLIGLRAHAGDLTVQPVPAESIGDAPDLPARLAEQVPVGGKEWLNVVVWQVMAEDPAMFTEPVAPLSEFFAAAGLVVDKDYVARAGFDFTADRERTRAVWLANEYGLGLDTATTMAAIVKLADARSEVAAAGVSTALVERPRMFDGLDDFALAHAVLGYLDQRSDRLLEAIGRDRQDDWAAMTAVAQELTRRAPRRGRAGAHYLVGLIALRHGRAEAAETHFREAVDLDQSWGPAYRELASITALRGDYAGALAMFAMVPEAAEESLYRLLSTIAASTGPELGRNERCWCGSGRKYKVCHRGRQGLDGDAHAEMLYEKALDFLRTSEFVPQLLDLAEIRVGHRADLPIEHGLDDGLAFDVLLFDGGVFAAFIDRFGILLPGEDQLLAAQWLLGQRSVYEVESIGPGALLTLRDVRTGDRVDLTVPGHHELPVPGTFLCTRIVAAGERYRAYGGIEPIDPALRAELIELLDDPVGPEALIELLSRRLAPPRVFTEGAEVVFCLARFAIADTRGIRRRLSRRYGKGVADLWTWLDGNKVLGHLELATGDDGALELTVEAMTEFRFAEMLAAVAQIDPGARKLDEDRRTPDFSGAGRTGADRAGAAPPIWSGTGEMPAEAMELVETMIRDHEQAWVDESIPALGDRTPRECAADPTRRDDLIRLLDSFPQTDVPGAMSPIRLRAMLGL